MKKWTAPVLLVLLGWAGHALGLFASLDSSALDAGFRYLRAAHPVFLERDAAIVGIDEQTYARFPEPTALWQPRIGEFLRAMALAQPAAVGLDLTLPDYSFDALIPGHERTLLAGIHALRRAGIPLVFGETVDQNGAIVPIARPYLALAGPDSSGHTAVCSDPDQVVRRFDETLCDDGQAIASLAGQLARRSGSNADARGWIDFTAGPAFDYVPLQTVLDWLARDDRQALSQHFGRRIVLLGTVEKFRDRVAVPVALFGPEPGSRLVPGVLLHAQIARSLAGAGLLGPAPAVIPWAGILLSALFWFGRGRMKPVFLALFVLAVMAAAIAAIRNQWFIPVGGIAGMAAIAAAARLARDVILNLRERRRLKGAFSAYVSPPVLREILAGKLNPELGGTRCYVAVLFADIRDFTTRCEHEQPERIVELLNRYFDEMTQAVQSCDGTLGQFIGDGLLVYFGAPRNLSNPCENAVAAAKLMLERVAAVNAWLRERGDAGIRIGIGIHAGELVVGNIGSKTFRSYTIIGDVVNTASRLEGLSKTLGYPVIFSEEVVGRLADRTGVDDLGEQAVKGRAPVRVSGWPARALPNSGREA